MEDDDDIITIRKGEDEIILSEKRLRSLVSKFIEITTHIAATHNDFGMNIKTIDTLVNVKKAFFPEVNKNLNVNIAEFDTQVNKWMEARKEFIKAQKEGQSKKSKKEEREEEEEIVYEIQ